MRRLFRQFSFPGGIPSHVAPETPGSIHEGGELGYALSHAYGAAFDNPDLLVCCVVGDGEAETGPLATSWHSNKFLNPVTDGAVLPILHLNGYKIANPTVLARIGDDELNSLLEGYGHAVHWVDGDEPEAMHQRMAEVLDTVVEEIAAIQRAARAGGQDRAAALADDRAAHAEGLDGPEGGRREADGGHVALAPGAARRGPDEPRPPRAARGVAAELPARGALRRRAARLDPGARGAAAEERPAHEREPARERRPAAPGSRAARLPRLRGRRRRRPATTSSEATRVLGTFLRDVMRREPATASASSAPTRRRRTGSSAVFEVTDARLGGRDRCRPTTTSRPSGRVMEVLSEHQCQGWLEGYLLTGRHGLFNCYEAFIHIVDSMFNQHAKWLKTTRGDPVAAADRVAQLPALARTSGGRTTTASATRIRASSTTS